jgi:redox-sensitive bicupin YhaK (pirin superfamily)
MDPFIMLDYNAKTTLPPSDIPRGVGVHPHRGFETVTVAYKGKVAHHDSAGNSGVIGEGGVQWMTAASGILHKEYHESSFSRQGGAFQMVQLWVNLPARFKMSAPKYQGIAPEQIERYTLAENAGSIGVIAGNYQGVKGAASTFTELHMLDLRLNAGGTADFSFPAKFNTVLLAIEGRAEINGQEVLETDHLALFENAGEEFRIKALENTVLLLLSGEPIAEPIAAHGPFVMNTREELVQAFRDLHNGRFGFLAD